MNVKYITTPIYYTNGNPHLGHVYTTLAAMVLKRAYGILYPEDRAHVRTGVDEHGLKVQRRAEAMGMEPQKLCDEVAEQFREVFRVAGVDLQDFYRTTDATHEALARDVFARLVEAGDVYLSHYEGWYAVTDEAYYAEEETHVVSEGKRVASTTGSAVTWVEEEAYFFRLSAYKDRLLTWYEANPEAIQPASRRNEIIAFVKQGLRDLCITRKNFTWGVSLGPEYGDHVLYVWVDALSNYLARDKFSREVWPATVQLVGKDILRFHAVIWPALLMSIGEDLPTKIFAHGWWLTESGDKMAKSAGNAIDPLDLIEKYDGPEALTYYMFREVPFGEDGKFSSDRVEIRYKELQNKYGNLANRIVSMVEKYGLDVPLAVLGETPQEIFAPVKGYYEELALHKVLEHVVTRLDAANKFLQDSQPWAKTHSQDVRQVILTRAMIDLYDVSILLSPFLPRQATEVSIALARSALQSHKLNIPILFPPAKVLHEGVYYWPDRVPS